MSDIGIRFDGLVLAGTIAISAAIFALILLAATILAMISRQRRRYCIGLAKIALAHTLISLACLLGAVLTMNQMTVSISSPDWLDWLTLPWIMLFLAGVVRLIRFHPLPDATD